MILAGHLNTSTQEADAGRLLVQRHYVRGSALSWKRRQNSARPSQVSQCSAHSASVTEPIPRPLLSQVMSLSLHLPQQATVLQAWVQHPHLGRGPLALGSGSQLDRHSGMNPRCCRSGLARRAEAAGHIRPHLLHTPSHGSQPGKHSGKSRAGFRRPRGHRGLGSGCIHRHLHGASKSRDVRCDSPSTPCYIRPELHSDSGS